MVYQLYLLYCITILNIIQTREGFSYHQYHGKLIYLGIVLYGIYSSDQENSYIAVENIDIYYPGICDINGIEAEGNILILGIINIYVHRSYRDNYSSQIPEEVSFNVDIMDVAFTMTSVTNVGVT